MNTPGYFSALLRLPQSLLIGVVRGYRLLLSPSLGSSCRFTPSCSVYALAALQQHGAAGGSYLAAARIARCHPWCDGGVDDVPTQLRAPLLFSRLMGTPVPPSATALSSPSQARPVSKTLL
ncbi:MAG: membrane protein insertion efficiency factor YidD [Burkholderiaceae bacterium]